MNKICSIHCSGKKKERRTIVFFFCFEFLVTYLIKIVAEGKKEVQKKNNPILFSHIFVCIYFRAQGSGKMFSLGGSMNHDLHQFTFLRRS